MKNVFSHLGGVPYEVSFDNDIAIVKVSSNGKGTQTKTPTELFLRFKNHYRLISHFCNSRTPNEKAHVEVGIKTIRTQLLSPIPEIVDFDLFNKQASPLLR